MELKNINKSNIQKNSTDHILYAIACELEQIRNILDRLIKKPTAGATGRPMPKGRRL